MRVLPGVEASTGSLGQGLSIGIGHALAGRVDGRGYRVYVMIGDGEADEGQIWEASMAAVKFKLENLTLLLDNNQFQQTGSVEKVMPALLPFADKWRAFGWHVQEIDGHNLEEVLSALKSVQELKDQPQVIVCHTKKGKGLSPFEKDEVNRKHGVPLKRKKPKLLMLNWTNNMGTREALNNMDIGKSIGLSYGPPTRNAFGESLKEIGRENSNLIVLDGDVANSTRTEYFAREFPDRFFNVGIAESNLVGIASGLAASGKDVLAASFACFLLSNAYDQIRMSVAFPNLNVKLVGSHSGISIGEDGPSQMAIEDIALATSFPNFTVLVPADGPSAKAATRAMFAHEGPVYLRTGRPKVPVIYEDEVPFEIGKANRLREGRDLTIIACGLMVAAALEAADQLSSGGYSGTRIGYAHGQTFGRQRTGKGRP